METLRNQHIIPGNKTEVTFQEDMQWNKRLPSKKVHYNITVRGYKDVSIWDFSRITEMIEGGKINGIKQPVELF